MFFKIFFDVFLKTRWIRSYTEEPHGYRSNSRFFYFFSKRPYSSWLHEIFPFLGRRRKESKKTSQVNAREKVLFSCSLEEQAEGPRALFAPSAPQRLVTALTRVVRPIVKLLIEGRLGCSFVVQLSHRTTSTFTLDDLSQQFVPAYSMNSAAERKRVVCFWQGLTWPTTRAPLPLPPQPPPPRPQLRVTANAIPSGGTADATNGSPAGGTRTTGPRSCPRRPWGSRWGGGRTSTPTPLLGYPGATGRGVEAARQGRPLRGPIRRRRTGL